MRETQCNIFYMHLLSYSKQSLRMSLFYDSPFCKKLRVRKVVSFPKLHNQLKPAL